MQFARVQETHDASLLLSLLGHRCIILEDQEALLMPSTDFCLESAAFFVILNVS